MRLTCARCTFRRGVDVQKGHYITVLTYAEYMAKVHTPGAGHQWVSPPIGSLTPSTIRGYCSVRLVHWDGTLCRTRGFRRELSCAGGFTQDCRGIQCASLLYINGHWVRYVRGARLRSSLRWGHLGCVRSVSSRNGADTGVHTLSHREYSTTMGFFHLVNMDRGGVLVCGRRQLPWGSGT